MGKYLLGLDSGNTVCKATLFDLGGHVVANSSARVPSYHPAVGRSERNLVELWKYAAKVIRTVITRAQIRPEEIAAVGICGHGNGLYLLDRARKPLRAIQSLDTRAGGICRSWKASRLEERIYPYTRQILWPAQTNSLLSWTRKEEPEIFDQIGTVFLSKDYLNFCLTGEVASDYSDMSVTNLLDIHSKQVSPFLLHQYGLDGLLQALPRLMKSTEVLGTVTVAAARETGLMKGTKVVAGMLDVCANMIGSGIRGPGPISVIAGTWSVNATLTARPLESKELSMTSLFANTDYYVSIEADASSMTNLEWFVGQFCESEVRKARRAEISVFKVCDQMLASHNSGPGSPFYLPYLYGGNFNTNAKGGFIGLTGWHRKTDLMWAVYEGIVFGHRYHIEKLKNAGVREGNIRLTGGGSASRVFGQLMADVLNTTVEISGCNETGTWGAAYTAGVGAGIYTGLHEVPIDTSFIFQPNPAMQDLHDDRYNSFKLLAESIYSSTLPGIQSPLNG
jgi:L-xylulokinase